MKQFIKISGIAYVMIFLGGFYANFAILESLVVHNDPTATLTNLIQNHSQFGNGLLGFAVMLVFDLLLVWSLFYVTRPVSIKRSYLASFFRFLHALFFLMALHNLRKAWQLTEDATASMLLESRIQELLANFDLLWTIGLLFFGVHLLVLGYLAVKSSMIPKAIGYLLLLAAMGYIIDDTVKLVYDNYQAYKSFFEIGVVFTGVIGELSFTIWLWVKGFSRKAMLRTS